MAYIAVFDASKCDVLQFLETVDLRYQKYVYFKDLQDDGLRYAGAPGVSPKRVAIRFPKVGSILEPRTATNATKQVDHTSPLRSKLFLVSVLYDLPRRCRPKKGWLMCHKL
eukprot:6468955-Amphidinium_carterae.1